MDSIPLRTYLIRVSAWCVANWDRRFGRLPNSNSLRKLLLELCDAAATKEEERFLYQGHDRKEHKDAYVVSLSANSLKSWSSNLTRHVLPKICDAMGFDVVITLPKLPGLMCWAIECRPGQASVPRDDAIRHVVLAARPPTTTSWFLEFEEALRSEAHGNSIVFEREDVSSSFDWHSAAKKWSSIGTTHLIVSLPTPADREELLSIMLTYGIRVVCSGNLELADHLPSITQDNFQMGTALGDMSLKTGKSIILLEDGLGDEESPLHERKMSFLNRLSQARELNVEISRVSFGSAAAELRQRITSSIEKAGEPCCFVTLNSRLVQLLDGELQQRENDSNVIVTADPTHSIRSLLSNKGSRLVSAVGSLPIDYARKTFELLTSANGPTKVQVRPTYLHHISKNH